MTLGRVIVTATFARARPARVTSVKVIDPGSAASAGAPARMFPLNAEVVMVVPPPTHQNTLHGCPPLVMTTEKLVPERAAPILKIQTASASPRPSRINTPVPVNAAPVQ